LHSTPSSKAVTEMGGVPVHQNVVYASDIPDTSFMNGVNLGLLTLALVGFVLWMIGVFINAAGDKGPGYSDVSSVLFALFFCVVAGLVAVAHTSTLMASLAFYWTCLTAVYGWALIIQSLRSATNTDCTTWADNDWSCRSVQASIAGAAITVFAISLLACTLFWYHLSPMCTKAGVVGPNLGVQPPTVQYQPTATSPETAVNLGRDDRGYVGRDDRGSTGGYVGRDDRGSTGGYVGRDDRAATGGYVGRDERVVGIREERVVGIRDDRQIV